MLDQSFNIKNQTGLSLIESLIALLIISVGLLGIAALQITSLQQSASSQWHSQAVWASYQMSDRIIANRSVFNSYVGIDTNDDFTQICQNAVCDPDQMILADAKDWKELLANFPEGRGIISSETADSLIISIMWKDNSDESNCVNGEPDATGMTCFTITVIK